MLDDKEAEKELKREVKRLSTAKPIPLYEAVDRSLGGTLHPFVYTEIILAIASIYAGYSKNSDDDNIIGSISHAINKISQVLAAIKNIMDRLDEVLRAIDAAVKLIERKVDRAFMQFHFNEMNAATNSILEVMEKLSKVPLDKNNLSNPQVTELRARLIVARENLSKAITGFAGHDGGEMGAPPTIATIINCSSSIALWARAYTLADDYYEPALRTPIWDLKAHSDLKGLYEAFFVDTEKTVRLANEAVEGIYYSPERELASRFEGGRFVRTSIRVEDSYPPDQQYSGLFCRRDADPFHLYWTRPSYFGEVQKWIWQRVSDSHDAAKWDRELVGLRRPLLEKLATYRPVLDTRSKMMNAFDRHG